MYQQKKPRDFRALWLASLSILVIGIVLTINMALIRPLGFALLVVGGVGMVWSLVHMDRWKDKNDRNEPRQFR
jgi:hypothetical protein